MTVTIKARPTTYKGIKMRSRLEATVAAWFDRGRIAWTYEPACFADERGQYLPDFRIDEFGVGGRQVRPIYVEVKPRVDTGLESALRRMEIVWSSEPHADLLVIAPSWLEFAYGLDFPGEDGLFGWPNSPGAWVPNESGGATEFCTCAVCRDTSIVVWTDCYACARCTAWDGDHYLRPCAAGDDPTRYEG